MEPDKKAEPAKDTGMSRQQRLQEQGKIKREKKTADEKGVSVFAKHREVSDASQERNASVGGSNTFEKSRKDSFFQEEIL